MVTRADHMVPKHGGPFNKHEFNEHPERYTSKFATEVRDFILCFLDKTSGGEGRAVIWGNFIR